MLLKPRFQVLTLKNVLESTPNLSLTQLFQYFEAHFDRQNATNICSKLTSMGQLLEKSKYQYVIRCIEIRQKIILASNNSDIMYDKELVRKVFNCTLEKWILSLYVLLQIKSLIRNNECDEDLITAAAKTSTTKKVTNLVQGKHMCLRLIAHPIDQVKWIWILRLITLAMGRLINIFLL